jgi:predicted Na+-dependent transporter
MTFLFRVLAVAMGAAALYFYLTDKFDWAFAFVAFAVCSYFFGMRFQIKARLAARQAAEDAPPEQEPPA